MAKFGTRTLGHPALGRDGLRLAETLSERANVAQSDSCLVVAPAQTSLTVRNRARFEFEKACAMTSPSMRVGLILVDSEIALICDTLERDLARREGSPDDYRCALRLLFPTSVEEVVGASSAVADFTLSEETLVPVDTSRMEIAAMCGLLGARMRRLAAHTGTGVPEVDAAVYQERAIRLLTLLGLLEGLL